MNQQQSFHIICDNSDIESAKKKYKKNNDCNIVTKNYKINDFPKTKHGKCDKKTCTICRSTFCLC